MSEKKEVDKNSLIPDNLVKEELNKLLNEVIVKLIKYPTDKFLISSKKDIDNFISQIPNKPNGFFRIDENGWSGDGLEYFKIVASYLNLLK